MRIVRVDANNGVIEIRLPSLQTSLRNGLDPKVDLPGLDGVALVEGEVWRPVPLKPALLGSRKYSIIPLRCGLSTVLVRPNLPDSAAIEIGLTDVGGLSYGKPGHTIFDSCRGGAPDAIVRWLIFGDRDPAVDSMCRAMFDTPPVHGCNANEWPCPLDPDSFLRCMGFLDNYQAGYGLLDRIAAKSPQWHALITHWRQIESALIVEAAEGTFRRTQTLMERVLEDCP